MSASGTTLQNLIDRVADGRLAVQLVLVVSSNADAYGLERAVRAGLRIVVLTQQLRRTVAELQIKNAELMSSRAEVTRLEGMLPICASCKKVRNERDEWQELDLYLESHPETDLQEGLCPHCRATHESTLMPQRKLGT